MADDCETARLWFHTDASSSKVGDSHKEPSVCIVAWDPMSGVQLRLCGCAVMHHNSVPANEHWEQVSRAAIWLYGEPARAGGEAGRVDLRLPRDREQLVHRLTARERNPFVVLEIIVESMDWLQATPTERGRAHMISSDQWRAVPVGA